MIYSFVGQDIKGWIEEYMFLDKNYFIILYSCIFYVFTYLCVTCPNEGDEVKIPVLLRKILFPLLGKEKVRIGLSIVAGYLIAGNIIFYGLKLTVCRLYDWTDLNTAWVLLFILFVLIGGLCNCVKEVSDEMTKISWGQALMLWIAIIILSIMIIGHLIILFLFSMRNIIKG